MSAIAGSVAVGLNKAALAADEIACCFHECNRYASALVARFQAIDRSSIDPVFIKFYKDLRRIEGPPRAAVAVPGRRLRIEPPGRNAAARCTIAGNESLHRGPQSAGADSR